MHPRGHSITTQAGAHIHSSLPRHTHDGDWSPRNVLGRCHKREGGREQRAVDLVDHQDKGGVGDGGGRDGEVVNNIQLHRLCVESPGGPRWRMACQLPEGGAGLKPSCFYSGCLGGRKRGVGLRPGVILSHICTLISAAVPSRQCRSSRGKRDHGDRKGCGHAAPWRHLNCGLSVERYQTRRWARPEGKILSLVVAAM